MGELRLLVVEDEATVRLMLEEVLIDADFNVQTVQNGLDAIATLEQEDVAIDALLTDVRLGEGPDGWAVGRKARERTPHVPVVYITADSAHEWESEGVPGSVLIRKPFTIAQVTEAVIALVR